MSDESKVLVSYASGDEVDPTLYPHDEGDWYKKEDVDALLGLLQTKLTESERQLSEECDKREGAEAEAGT